MKVSRHDHFSLYVKDVEQSARWYQDILGLEPRHVDVWWNEHTRFVGYGDALIALFQQAEKYGPVPQDMTVFNHQAFRVGASEFEFFKNRLAEKEIPFDEMDHTISRSVYFQDLDGYWIELTTYVTESKLG